MRNIRTKYSYYFQGLRVLRCHWTKRLNHVNYRSNWPRKKTFSSLTPPPAWISRVFDPPSRKNFQNPVRRGGADFFWNNPMLKNPEVCSTKCTAIARTKWYILSNYKHDAYMYFRVQLMLKSGCWQPITIGNFVIVLIIGISRLKCNLYIQFSELNSFPS